MDIRPKQLCSWCALFIGATLLWGCTTIPLNLNTDRVLNIDSHQQSLPVRVKLYQLSDTTLFNEATFHQLWKSDNEVLNGTLLEKREFTLNPNEQKKVSLTHQSGATHLALIALYRAQSDNDWKAMVPLKHPVNYWLNPVAVHLKSNRIWVKS